MFCKPRVALAAIAGNAKITKVMDGTVVKPAVEARATFGWADMFTRVWTLQRLPLSGQVSIALAITDVSSA